MCAMTFTIGFVDPNTLTLVGGDDFPLVIFNPNFHMKCENPGACILSGGAQQLYTFSDDAEAAFVGAVFNLAPPVGYVVDWSNMLIEGMTFTQSSMDCDCSSEVRILSNRCLCWQWDCVVVILNCTDPCHNSHACSVASYI